jgi:hypothetical protein
MDRQEGKIRRVVSRGTASYQLGYYEIQGSKGKSRSMFKVDIHVGEHATSDEALAAWPKRYSSLGLSEGRARQTSYRAS